MNKIKWTTIGLLLGLISLFPFNAGAQSTAPEHQNRIRVSYSDGIYTTVSMAMFESIITLGTLRDLDSPGTFTLGYRRITNSGRWGFGGDLTLFPTTRTIKIGSAEEKVSSTYFMVMAGADCYYKKSGLIRLYGTVDAGVLFASGTGTEAGFAYQINPIALRVGSDRIAGFAEVGYGFKGMFNIGLEIGF